jgi:formylglycine-generating enzyme required for sulfatase activity
MSPLRILAALAAVVVAVAQAPAQAPLAWRLNPDDRLYVEYDINRQENNQIQGRAASLNEDHAQVYRYTVLSRKPEGAVELDAVLESTRVSNANSILAQQTSILKSEHMRAALDAGMNVVRLDGPEAVARRNPVRMPGLKAIAPRLIDDEVRTMLTDAFVSLPGRPTAKGEHWQQTTTLAQPGIGLFVQTRTFTDEGDDTLDGRPVRKIGVTAVLEVRPATWDESEMPPQRPLFTLKAQEYAGTVYFDAAAGRLVKLERRQFVRLDCTSAAEQGKKPLGYTEQTTTLTVRVLDHNPMLVKPAKAGPPADPKPPQSGPNSAGVLIVGIPAGKFMMGSPDDEDARDRSEQLHEVELTQPFYMSVHPVTVGQFRKFVEETGYRTAAETDGLASYGWNDQKHEVEPGADYNWKNPGYQQTDNHPVVLLEWKDARAFCEWLSKREGRHYRLPTEAEWEFCCRAGTNTRYYSGDDDTSAAAYGNVVVQAGKQAPPAAVGSFKPNAWGLCDMHGNVWQWCQDWYWKDYDASGVKDPKGAAFSDLKAARGGSWMDSASRCRSAARGSFGEHTRAINLGFRIVLEMPQGQQ